MSRLKVSLLGTMIVERDGAPVTGFRSESARALLAYLVMAPGREHPRSVLAALLWPERSEQTARGNLRTALAYLRQAIRDDDPQIPFILASRDAIAFNQQSDHWFDVAAFRELAAAGDVPSLEQSVALYRGDFASGLRVAGSAQFEEWLVLERDRLQRQVLDVLAELSQALETRGDLSRACDWARRALEIAPWLENAHRQVMRLLAVSGKRAAALSQYETCARMLRAELDVAPAQETIGLYEAIRDGAISGQGGDERGDGHLPVPLIPLVGRQRELAEISARLADPSCRLLTILGPGGIGKTHLALMAGRQAEPDFAHGTAFVRLGSLDRHDAVASAMAQALGIPMGSDQADTPSSAQRAVISFLHAKEMLLVLDEFERFLDAAGLLADILGAAPKIKALVTTRVRLGLPGETLYPLLGLRCEAEANGSCPALDAPAVALFVQAAERASPGYRPDATDLEAIGRICHRLEGSPLALLLAAAWTEALPIERIADSLEDGQALDFLATERRPGEGRHASMRAVLDSSYALLDPGLRRILAKLSCFVGPFTAGAAEAVAGATLRDVVRLLHRSMIHRAGERHYSMHTLLRSFGREKLDASPGEARDARARHAAFYADAMVSWRGDLKGRRQAQAEDEISAEFENVRAAWRFAAEEGRLGWLAGLSDGLAIYCDALCRYGDQHAMFEVAAERLHALLEGDDQKDPAGWRVLARLESWRARSLLRLLRRDEAHEAAKEAERCLEQAAIHGLDARRERALVLWTKADVAAGMEGLDAIRAAQEEGMGPAYVRALLQESLAMAEEVGDDWLAASVLMLWGSWQGGPLGSELLARCIDMRRRLGDQRGLSIALPIAATRAPGHASKEDAERLLEESLELLGATGLGSQHLAGLRQLGLALSNQGRYEESRQVFARLVQAYTDLGYQDLAAWCRSRLAAQELHLGDYAAARAHLIEELDYPSPQFSGHTYYSLFWLALAQRDEVEARRWLEAGTARGREHGVEWSPGPLALGLLALAEGDTAVARSICREAIVLRRALPSESRSLPMSAVALSAMIAAATGKGERAVELWALCARHPRILAARMNHDLYGRTVEEAAASLPPEVVEAAWERGRALDAAATLDALLVEMEA